MTGRQVVGRDAHRVFRNRFLHLILIVMGLVLALGSPRDARGTMPSRNGGRSLAKSYPNPKMMARLKEAQAQRLTLGANSVATPPIHGDQATVFILIEGQNYGIPNPYNPYGYSAPFNPALRDPSAWTGLMNEMDTYYNEVSRGIVRIKPAKETFGVADDGIVGPVTVPYLSSFTTDSLGGMLAVEAIKAANPYIDYSYYDKNLDGQIDADELHIVIIQAGYDSDYTYPYPSPGPSTPANTYATDPMSYYYGYPGFTLAIPGLIPLTDSDSIAITSYMYIGSEFYTPGKTTRVGMGILAHEFGHDIGLPDLYDVDSTGTTTMIQVPNANNQLVWVPYVTPSGWWSGLGPYCLMSGGGWGEDLQATKPSHISGYLKSYLGWAQETDVTAPTNQQFSLPASSGSNAVLRVNVPNSRECFIIENRQQFGYDASLPGTQGGLAIFHVDEGRFFDYPNLMSPTWPLFYNISVNNEPLDYGIQLMQADGSNSLMRIPPRMAPFYTASDRDLYRLGNVNSFSTLTSPSTALKTGLPSGLAITDISASAPVMTFNMTYTNQIGFAQRLISVNEGQKQANVVVSLAPAAENAVSIDYSVLGGTATSGVDYKLTPGTLTFEPGQTSKYFTIDLVNDWQVEGSENIRLALSNPKGAILNTTSSQTLLNIVDNDNPYVNVVYPNGGEKLTAGTWVTAQWTANTAVIGKLVNIDLYVNGLYDRTLAWTVTCTAALGSKNSAKVWVPTDLPLGANYQIAVVSAQDATFHDESDEKFSITDPNVKVTGFTLANGEAVTATRLVNMSITVPSWIKPDSYMVSESSAFTGAKWLPFTANGQFTLSKGDWTHRVYVKIRKDAQESPAVSAVVTLKEAAAKPVIQTIPDATVGEHQTYCGPTPILVSGIQPVMWSLLSGPAGLLINPASGVVTWKDPTRYVAPAVIRIRATNPAGYADVQWQVNVAVGDLGAALNASRLTWNDGGAQGWYAQSLVTHDGEGAVRSQPVRDGGKAVMTATVNGPGIISFWWKVSSEVTNDKLSLSIGGSRTASISGEQDWAYYEAFVPPGQQEVAWTYAKDLGVTAGQDAGFVDQVTFQPAMKVTKLSRSGYVLGALRSNCPLYSDTGLTKFVGQLPAPLQNQLYIRTSTADRKAVTSSLLKFTVDQPVTVILAMDERFSAPPSWAKSYTKLGFSLATTAPRMNLYAKQFKAGQITLGGASDNGNSKNYKMYSIILVPTSAVSVSELSKSTYATGSCKSKTLAVTNGKVTFGPATVSPLYGGARAIRTNYTDNRTKTDALFSFKADRAVTVVVGFDSRMKNPPSWAAKWQNYGDTLQVSDGPRKLYAKRFPAGQITLGGNTDPGVKGTYHMYNVIVMPSY